MEQPDPMLRELAQEAWAERDHNNNGEAYNIAYIYQPGQLALFAEVVN